MKNGFKIKFFSKARKFLGQQTLPCIYTKEKLTVKILLSEWKYYQFHFVY